MEITAMKNVANTLGDSINIIENNGLLREAKSNLKKYELDYAVSADILDEIKSLDKIRTKRDFAEKCNELREKLVSMINHAETPDNDPEPKNDVIREGDSVYYLNEKCEVLEIVLYGADNGETIYNIYSKNRGCCISAVRCDITKIPNNDPEPESQESITVVELDKNDEITPVEPDFKSLEYNPKKMNFVNLYHGTDQDFEEFENSVLSSENSIDQYGSGFYFYNEENSSKTSLHGGIQIRVRAWLENPIKHDDNSLKLTKDQIHSLLCASPDLDYKLENFGEVDFDGFDKVLDIAVLTYYENHWLDTLNMIGNDFFEPESTYLLLKEFFKQTGHNCITDEKRGIIVMLRKSDFEIVEKNYLD